MNLLKLFLVTITLFAVSANAAKESTGRGNEGGGGDPCENRIKVVAQDIKSWILKGGPQDLDLPANITVEHYSRTMIEQIEKAQVTCVEEKDPGYPVQVNGEAKVCRFDRKDNLSKITCDSKKFESLNETDQYVLIHHEYAGLAGLEKPNGASSNYEISNQISAYLENFVIKKLVVGKKTGSNNTNTLKGLLYVTTGTTDNLEAADLSYEVVKCLKFDGRGQETYNCVHWDEGIAQQRFINRVEFLMPGQYFLYKFPMVRPYKFTIKSSEKTTIKVTALSTNDLIAKNPHLKNYFLGNEKFNFTVYTNFSDMNERNYLEKITRSEVRNLLEFPYMQYLDGYLKNSPCLSKQSVQEILDAKKMICTVGNKSYPVEIQSEAQRFLDIYSLDAADQGYYLNEYSENGQHSLNWLSFLQDKNEGSDGGPLVLRLKGGKGHMLRHQGIIEYDKGSARLKKLILLPGNYIINVWRDNETADVVPISVK